MLFKPEFVAPILAGRQTQTRRFWPDEHPMVRVGGTYWAQTRLFKPSSRFARIKVVALDWVPLDPVSPEDAWAEGYDSVAACQEVFQRINGRTWWPSNEMVWRVKFVVAGQQEEKP